MLKNRRFQGILLALISAVFFALANTLTGVANNGGTNPFTMTATRFILPAVLLFLILLLKGKPVLLDRRAGTIAAALGVVTMVYTFALLKAIELLPVTIAILLFYLFPILTAFMLGLFGWGKVSTRMMVSAFIAFFGLGLTLAVQFDELSTIGMWAGVASAVGFAICCAVSHTLMQGQDSWRVTLYISGVATLSMAVVMTFAGDFRLPESGTGWAGFMFSHLLYGTAIIGFYASISLVGAAASTFFVNLEPIVVVGAGYVLLGQTIMPLQMVGVAIVVAALVYASRSKEPEPVLSSAE